MCHVFLDTMVRLIRWLRRTQPSRQSIGDINDGAVRKEGAI